VCRRSSCARRRWHAAGVLLALRPTKSIKNEENPRNRLTIHESNKSSTIDSNQSKSHPIDVLGGGAMGASTPARSELRTAARPPNRHAAARPPSHRQPRHRTPRRCSPGCRRPRRRPPGRRVTSRRSRRGYVEGRGGGG
jgi:hypothetical protein